MTEDDGTLIADITIVDMQLTGGGMYMQEWKHSRREKDKGKRVIGVYFEVNMVNMMGHELDQWRYYDVDSGKDVT